MRKILIVALLYFCIVFAAGFALGTVRVLFLVPVLGERYAELAEMPLMIATSAIAARYLILKYIRDLSFVKACIAGAIALVLLLAVEFTVVLTLRGISISESIASRDPVSGLAYLISLLFYSAAPALFYVRGGKRGA
jgi:hypothetical protein